MRRRYELPDAPAPVDGLDADASRRLGDAVRRAIRAAALVHATGDRRAGSAGGRHSGPVREAFGGGRDDDVPSYDRQGQPVTVPVLPSPAPPASPAGAPGPAAGAPWVGEISAQYNAALRRQPFKDPEHPYDNIDKDLRWGTQVTVSAQEHGWLRVQVGSGPAARSGWVSHELVRHVGPVPAPAAPEPDLILADPLVSALNALHRAERQRQSDPSWEPSPPERKQLDVWANIVELNPQYIVDRQTFHAGFILVAPIEVTTIEDFILFVETVEAQYPDADARQVAGEIRQLAYPGPNFESLINGLGIMERNRQVNIESPDNPVAKLFDLKTLKERAHNMPTALGTVDVLHTIAGLDAALNGGPPPRGDLAVWEAVNKADAGDPRDVATWAGDLGQAYAEFLVQRYKEGDLGASLGSVASIKASDAQLLGDIHGYIVLELWRQRPRASLADLAVTRVSDILRAMYLETPPGPSGSEPSYRKRVEQVSGVSGADLRALMRRRVLATARVWYANAVYHLRTRWMLWPYGVTEAGVIERLMQEFDRFHVLNEREGRPGNQVDVLIDHFLSMLDGPGI
jgi:hypothetical protein